jgi:hypothetical protein
MREMEEIVKLLDECLEYLKHEVSGGRITIWVESANKEVICPYCGKPSKKYICCRIGSCKNTQL